MTSVALVVTGRLEFRGLAPALKRLFPDADLFISLSMAETDLKDSTSALVDPAGNQRDADARRTPAIDDLIEHLAGNLCGREPAHFSVLVEDLELINRGNEVNVVRAVRESVVRHVAKVEARRDGPRDLRERLRERASFHLFDPMIETYFYDDPRSLDAAQGVLKRIAHRARGRDPERFEVDASVEVGYFGEVGECPRHRRPKDRKCPWDGASRGEHPKKYLKYLCREEPPNEFCSAYKETRGGAAALAELDWSSVFANPGSAPFLRALVEDLAAAIGHPPVIRNWPAALTSTAPTALSRVPRERVLRNL